MPTTQTFYFDNLGALADFRLRALHWLQPFANACLLDTNQSPRDPKSQYHWLLAAGAETEFVAHSQALPALDSWLQRQQKQSRWAFGALHYELKNEIEPAKINSRQANDHQLPLAYFFCPQILIIAPIEAPLRIEIQAESASPQAVWEAILASPAIRPHSPSNAQVHSKVQAIDYEAAIQQTLHEIQQGNVYEINYCQEFFLPFAPQNQPTQLYQSLNAQTQNPFAAYLRYRQHHLCCASPERFLHKQADMLFSQPIKGTRPRGATPEKDQQLAQELLDSEKDRAENLMIVDLVRNDLSRLCLPTTVQTVECCALYPFPSVLQLVSSIQGQLPEPQPTFSDVLRATFPMGSMTGAPKIAAMQLIDQLETSARHWYSGSVGYIKPNNDFDFNVVIRSFYYNQHRKSLVFQVGGAIVADSQPQEEYMECMTKIQPLLRCLAQDSPNK